MTAPFLAVDWGTTNLRAWVVGRDGHASPCAEFPLGIGKLEAGEAAQKFTDTIRPRMDASDLPAVLCGMVGSNLGWTSVPYLDSPVDLHGLHERMYEIPGSGPPVWIVPGVRCERPDGGPDVMRGEETQVLGWMSLERDRSKGEYLICQPGTHTKWVRLRDGRVHSFVTSMTGEIYDLLTRHSILKTDIARHDLAAFDAGVAAAGDGNALASRLFTTRARVVGGSMDPLSVAPYLSGVLIGAEVASTPALLGIDPCTPITVIGDPSLTRHYMRAMQRRGLTAHAHDGERAGLAGLSALANQILAQ